MVDLTESVAQNMNVGATHLKDRGFDALIARLRDKIDHYAKGA